jgi:hypothetical protein
MTDPRGEQPTAEQRRLADEHRARLAALTAATRRAPEADAPVDDAPVTQETDEDEDDAPARRMEQQTLWVDLQVRQAMERGEFDNLPGAGRPIRGLDDVHDPDWWAKQLIEREEITGALPPALALRREDAELETTLDREATEDGVRRVVADFNRRVVHARRQLQGGPPVVTPTRDADAEVTAWRSRREQRRERQREQLARLRESDERTGADRRSRTRRARDWLRRGGGRRRS